MPGVIGAFQPTLQPGDRFLFVEGICERESLAPELLGFIPVRCMQAFINSLAFLTRTDIVLEIEAAGLTSSIEVALFGLRFASVFFAHGT